jgi:probable DNA metabolism protein
MHTLIYDGTFDGFLSAVFDVYYYKFEAPQLVTGKRFNGNIFEKVHTVHTNQAHSARVWTGLQKRLSPDALQQVQQTFLSQLPGIEAVLLQYLQYAFSTPTSIETNFGNAAVLMVHQTAKKVQREKHRMEAFVRFQQTADNLYYAIIEPDYDVLPLLTKHFQDRYADQRWLIWDNKRRYGIYYDLQTVTVVTISFEAETNNGKDISIVYDAKEELYQQLWQQYFKSVNIPARKNTRLHLQHMPMRYWKYLPEKGGAMK